MVAKQAATVATTTTATEDHTEVSMPLDVEYGFCIVIIRVRAKDPSNNKKVIHHTYRIVASRSTSRLVTCLGLFRLLMKGIFGPYVGPPERILTW